MRIRLTTQIFHSSNAERKAFQLNLSSIPTLPEVVPPSRSSRRLIHLASQGSRKLAVCGESAKSQYKAKPTSTVTSPSSMKLKQRSVGPVEECHQAGCLHPAPPGMSSNAFHTLDAESQKTREGTSSRGCAEEYCQPCLYLKATIPTVISAWIPANQCQDSPCRQEVRCCWKEARFEEPEKHAGRDELLVVPNQPLTCHDDAPAHHEEGGP